MQLDRTDGCFVCGENNRMGIQACFHANPDLLCSFARVVLPSHFQGWGEIVHGGVLAALLDEACIYAALGLAPKAVTAELQVRYRKPVSCGEAVAIFGEVVSHRRMVVTARSRLVMAGEVHATAEARIFLDKSEK